MADNITVFTFKTDHTNPVSTSTIGDMINIIESFITEELDNTESKISIVISSQQMTQEEYDNLPEFEGF